MKANMLEITEKLFWLYSISLFCCGVVCGHYVPFVVLLVFIGIDVVTMYYLLHQIFKEQKERENE